MMNAEKHYVKIIKELERKLKKYRVLNNIKNFEIQRLKELKDE